MRKTFKKVLSAACAVMLSVGAMAVLPNEVKADEDEYLMYLAYGGDAAEENDWGLQYYGDGAASNKGDVVGTTAMAKVGDTVTIGVKFPAANHYTWFMAPVIVAEGVSNVDYTIDKVTIDGEDVTSKIDLSLGEKAWWYEGTGDYTDTQAIRLKGGYNEWADKYLAESPAGVTEITYTITIKDITVGGEAPTEEATEATGSGFDPAGEYNAYLGIQTPNWTYRDAWNNPNSGLGSDVWGSFIYGNETKEKYGVVTDAKVAGNGTYTVSLTDFGTIISDDFTTADQDHFNLLFISTDIPRSDDVKITDVKIIMDGKTIKTFDNAVLDEDDEDYVKILIQNIWNEDVKELPFYNAPSKSVEMTFTISGFNYDNEAAAGSDETTASDDKTDADNKTDANNQATEANAEDKSEDDGSVLPIVIAVVAVVVVIGVVVVVIGKKKK